MFRNYIIIAFRNITKRKLNSLINITGLAVSLAAFALIILWVRYELSYDSYNKNADRIFRITTYIKQENGGIDMAMTAPPVAAALKQLPEVSNAVRILGPKKNVAVKTSNYLFGEDNFFFAGSSLFKIFTLPLLEGDPANALQNPYSVVISESAAKKYFGKSDPIGKSLNVKWDNNEHEYLVTGVMKDIPQNSHIHADFFASLNTLETLKSNFNSGWQNVSLYTYVLLKKNTPVKEFNQKLSGIIKQYAGSEAAAFWFLNSQNIKSIHLYSHRLLEIEPNGNAASIYIFTSAGFIILLIALINFVSLSTAGFTDRAKEVGVRKVLGAERKELVIQFMIENIMVVAAALAAAILLIEICLPYYNILIGKNLDFSLNNSLLIIAVGLLLTVFATSYPAYFLSSFSPVRSLNKKISMRAGKVSFRKGLIIVQFVAATSLIICSVLISSQMHYVMKKNLGINISRVVYIPMMQPDLRAKYPILRNELMKLNGVENVSASTSNPANMNMINSLYHNDSPVLGIKNIGVDYGFIKTMGLHLISGRNFSTQISSDTSQAIIINKTAAEKLKAMKLLDDQFEFHFGNYVRKGIKVIGIINDYNYRPLYYKVEPLILYIKPGDYRYAEVKILPGNMQETIDGIKKVWHSVAPNYPFSFSFLDQDLQKVYESDKRIGNVFDIFSVLGIFIGCMGLFGLASFSAAKRTKEIGIRKVLGSSVKEIIFLIAKDFLYLVLVAGVIAVPVSYYFINNWLEQFAYKIVINPAVFVISISVVLFIAFLTISYHAIKAATANPVEALKYE